MANKDPSYEGLVSFAKGKTDIALKKADEALKLMVKKQMKINFNSVAEESGISKGFLYKNKNLRERIEMLRRQQDGLISPKQVKRNMSDASKDVIIASLRSRIGVLEQENKQLKEQLKTHYGKLYEQI
jgi:cysteine sulfinate desulfinase/cysteine desulfurase-like protein